MDEPALEEYLTIEQLPQMVQKLFQRAQQKVLPGEQGQSELFVRYLRRKPGRGLAVIYDASERLPRGQRATAMHRAISLTLGEAALQGAALRLTPEQVQQARLVPAGDGLLQVPELELALQAFPTDHALPHLALCCAPHLSADGSGLLWHELQEAARVLLDDAGWHLLAAQAVPVRYKPGSRCVIRYDLQLRLNEREAQIQAVSLFGKVYADPEQAASVQELTRRLYAEQLAFQGSTVAGLTQQTPSLPRTLRFLPALGLVLTEAVRPLAESEVVRTGTRVLQPVVTRSRHGRAISTQIPESELRQAALALARLHTSQVQPAPQTRRAGSKEARRARERAALLMAGYPALAAQIESLVQMLAQRLETLQPTSYRPAHGGFKASQLLYAGQRIAVVDFDGFCLADPALDAGYFLAYLRPSGLWYDRQGTRAWFQAASTVFTATYASALQELGVSPDETAGILQRAHTYAAALLFKIATRRVNRLNSPRPQELAKILGDIASSLTL